MIADGNDWQRIDNELGLGRLYSSCKAGDKRVQVYGCGDLVFDQFCTSGIKGCVVAVLGLDLPRNQPAMA